MWLEVSLQRGSQRTRDYNRPLLGHKVKDLNTRVRKPAAAMTQLPQHRIKKIRKAAAKYKEESSDQMRFGCSNIKIDIQMPVL